MSARLLLVIVPADAQRREAVQALCAGKMECVFADPAEASPLLREAEAVFGQPAPALLSHASRLRWLQLSWAGADRYAPLLPEGTVMTNASGAYGVTIAEHAIAMLLSLARRLPDYQAQQRSACWHDLGPEWALEGRRALILGTGDLGTQLAVRLRAFGMETVGFCRHAAQPRGVLDRYITAPVLDEELRQADAVFGCLPGTAQTAGLLHEARLFAMKEDAILINVGRGSLISTEGLLHALAAGRFFGVGLDVTEWEPLPAEHPLWNAPRVLLTPHVAGVMQGHLPQTADRVWDIFLENLRRYLAADTLLHQVDPLRGY